MTVGAVEDARARESAVTVAPLAGLVRGTRLFPALRLLHAEREAGAEIKQDFRNNDLGRKSKSFEVRPEGAFDQWREVPPR
jgi:hypothetical protein